MRRLANLTATYIFLVGLLASIDTVRSAPLKIDFNRNDISSVEWETIDENDRDLGRAWSKRFSTGVSIEIFPIGGVSIGTRDRALSNGGGTDISMWRDFLFANGSLNANQGLDLRINGLIAHATYPIRIWSYDSGSRVSRLSTWNQNTYSFDGSLPPPQSLTDNLVSFELTADSEGTTTIRSRTGTPPGPYHNVFINGMEIGDPTKLPEGPTSIELSSNIASRTDPEGTLLATLSMPGAEPNQSFIYELAEGAGSDDNEFFNIQSDQLLLAKSLTSVWAGSALSLRIRSTDENQNAFESRLQIRVINGEGFVEPIRINELMAENQGSHLDGDNNAVDWIELHNPRSEQVNLEGFSLTDDPNVPNKWIFPSINIPAGEYLVVYAGSPVIDGIVQGDYRDAKGFYHFNFNLSASGEFLALVRPNGNTYESVFEPAFPSQFTDISYGLNQRGQWNYYAPPSPGRANGNGFDGMIKDTLFSVDRGFYDAPFQVTISTEEEGTSIHYTLDGSQPSVSQGQIYLSPIPINTTTTLRAIAFRDGWQPTNVDTHTYIFVDDVARQPAAPQGWPDNWGTNSEVNSNDGAGNGTIPADYEMDQRVVNNTIPGYGIRDALLDIPSVSVVMSQDDFITPGSGIYALPQTRIEKPCSIEYLLPDGATGFQENCKIEVHGNSSRRPWRMQKHSLRVTFTSDEGISNLDYPLFPDSPVSNFNKLVLRACFTDSWGLVSWGSSRYRPNDSQYIRDVWMKESLGDMGQPSSHGNFVHLYVNGLYFGLHNLTERLEDDFFSAHMGGNEEDWEINVDLSNPGTRWNQMMRIDTSTPEGYAEIQNFVDLANFSDYMLLHFYADSEDWPHHNGYAAANANSGDGRFRFFAWDQEIVLDKFTWNRYDRSDGVGALFQKMRQNPEFPLLFADRAHKHLSEGGALSMEQSQQRYLNLANQIDKAIVAESARWGDTQASTPYGNQVQQPSPRTNVDHDHYPPAPHAPDIYFTREDSWIVERDNVLNHYIPTLHDPSSRNAILNELRNEGLYPNIQAPIFSASSGHISSRSPIEITSEEGIIFYTLDGTDPHQPTSSIQTILLNDGASVMAVIPSNDTWELNWVQPEFEENSTWKNGLTGVGYETSPADYTGFIGMNVSEMRNENGSVYIRIPFQVESESMIESMTNLRLDMRYDDGFIAYLNGTRIAQANAPIGSPSWNSLARTTNPDSAASTFQAFDITGNKNLLNPGNNLLAIHGLNGSLNSSDLLITPRIVASRPDDSQQDIVAKKYQDPINLTESTILKARTLHNGEWSALTEAYYILETPASNNHLVISEIMYHPSASESLEFVELMNISNHTLALTGVRFTAGIDFEFPKEATLAPGGFAVITRSSNELSVASPGITIAGEFQNGTALANGGETLKLVGRDGAVIQSLRYDDQSPWPEQADGTGPSLVLKNPFDNPNPNDPANWQSSASAGGNPGAPESDGFVGDPNSDQDADGLPAIAEYYFGTSDLDPTDGNQALFISIEAFPKAEIPGDYLTIAFLHQTKVQDVQAIIEFSEDLALWSGETDAVISTSITQQENGLERRTYRSAHPVHQQNQEFVRLRFN